MSTSRIHNIITIREYVDEVRGVGCIVFTNGIFDLLHAGHLYTLSCAKSSGGPASTLIVGVNSDISTRILKGPKRPILDQNERALIVSSLKAVDAVVISDDVRWNRVIDIVRPDIYYKCGYALSQNGYELFDRDEYAALLRCNAEIIFEDRIEHESTTDIIKRIIQQEMNTIGTCD